jgi:MFS family permease
LWRHGDFRRLWVGDTISQVGTQLSGLALPVLAVQTLGAREVQLGVLTACQTLAFLLVGLPAGAWVDRWRKRRVLIANDLMRAILYGTIPLAWWAGLLTLGQLFVVAIAAGICTVFFDVAYQSYLPQLVDGHQMVAANSRLQASESVAQVGGPALAGGLLRLVSAPVLVGLDAVSFVASALLVSRIQRRESAPQRSQRRSLRTEIAEGLRFVLTHRLLRRIAACTSISNFFSAMSWALLVLYLLRNLQLSAGVVGLVFSASAVGGLVGALVTGPVTRLFGEGRTIALSAALGAPAAACTPLAGLVGGPWRLVLLVAGGFVFFAFVVVYNITQVSFRQRVCPPHLLGRMNASIRFLVWGTQPLGALAGGALGARFGIPPVLWIVVAGAGLAALPVLASPLIRMGDLDPGGRV